jgi:hypothetical protein
MSPNFCARDAKFEDQELIELNRELQRVAGEKNARLARRMTREKVARYAISKSPSSADSLINADIKELQYMRVYFSQRVLFSLISCGFWFFGFREILIRSESTNLLFLSFLAFSASTIYYNLEGAPDCFYYWLGTTYVDTKTLIPIRLGRHVARWIYNIAFLLFASIAFAFLLHTSTECPSWSSNEINELFNFFVPEGRMESTIMLVHAYQQVSYIS